MAIGRAYGKKEKSNWNTLCKTTVKYYKEAFNSGGLTELFSAIEVLCIYREDRGKIILRIFAKSVPGLHVPRPWSLYSVSVNVSCHVRWGSVDRNVLNLSCL